MVNYIEMGERIARAREGKGYTQETLAEAIEVSRNTISNIERGSDNFKFSIFDRICDVLGANPMELMYGVDVISDAKLKDIIAARDILNSIFK